MGPILNLCSACIVPISAAYRRRSGGIEGAIAMVQGSSTMNLPALVMVAMIFAPMLAGSRIVLSVIGGLLLGPLVATVVGERRRASGPEIETLNGPDLEMPWVQALREGFRDWARSSLGYIVRMGPIMVVAGFLSGLVIQWIDPDHVSTYLGNHALGIAIVATIGILINVPLLFEIPLVALLLLMGMGVAPAATLLFTAAAGGPVTFWGLARVMPRRAIVTFVTGTWVVGLAGGLIVWALPGTDVGLKPSVASADTSLVVNGVDDRSSGALGEGIDVARNAVFRGEPTRYLPFEIGTRIERSTAYVTPFTDATKAALGVKTHVLNDRPGVVVFDFDRDDDLDLYFTTEMHQTNLLYRNNGDGTFTDISELAGVDATASHSTGAVACDVNNDGYQDLYVGAWGNPTDKLDFRSPEGIVGAADNLFLNNGGWHVHEHNGNGVWLRRKRAVSRQHRMRRFGRRRLARPVRSQSRR